MNMLSKHGLLNEAAWVYVKGFLAISIEEQKKFSNVKKWHILDFPSLKSRCIEIGENRFALSILLDFAIAENDNS